MTSAHSEDRRNWETLVEKVLRGKTVDDALVTRTLDDIRIQPLYDRASAEGIIPKIDLPGMGAARRSATITGTRLSGWDICSSVTHTDLEHANDLILRDLAGGASSIEIETSAHPNSVQELAQLLDGVHLNMVGVSLSVGRHCHETAAFLMAIWKTSGISPARIAGALNCDPLGSFARFGGLHEEVDTAIAQAAELATYTTARYPEVTSLAVDSTIYHEAGASNAQEIAASLSTAVAYMRALERAGIDVADAASQIVFRVAVDADQIFSTAKIRTLRQTWGQVLKASGVSAEDTTIRIHAITSSRMLTVRDASVNIVRNTLACFSAAIAGADVITVLPHDIRFAAPNRRSRRIARNIQTVLKEESYLSKVIDPAGGSFALERLGDDLTQASWRLFQQLEGRGGMPSALMDGSFARDVEKTRNRLLDDVARRNVPITGVSEFPNLSEPPHEHPSPSEKAQAEQPSAGTFPNSNAISDLVAAAEAGATLADLAAEPVGDSASTEFPGIFLDGGFESLRRRSDAILAKTGTRPRILVVNLGEAKEFTARSGWAQNLFEAGGIEAILSAPRSTAETATNQLAEYGATLTVLCGPDRLYQTSGAAIARSLSDAGVRRVYLAGKPDPAFDECVDEFVHAGVDVLDVLQRALGLCEGREGSHE